MATRTVHKEGRPLQEQAAASENRFPFTRENYKIMIIGILVIILGYVLMVGGRSPDPNQFHPDQVYSWRRITLAPIVIIIGFLVEVYAIMKWPKQKKENAK
jgi:uncharacterized membrane protein YidH (DUF202 family)